MSKALDLLSKGIQKGFQAIEEHDIEKGRRWREQQEREEEKRERKREYLIFSCFYNRTSTSNSRIAGLITIRHNDSNRTAFRQ